MDDGISVGGQAASRNDALEWPVTLRGPLRKCALRAVRRLLAKAKGVSEKGLLTLTDEYMLGSGIDRTREVNNEKAEGADPVGEQLLREINPLLSLFGRWNLLITAQSV